MKIRNGFPGKALAALATLGALAAPALCDKYLGYDSNVTITAYPNTTTTTRTTGTTVSNMWALAFMEPTVSEVNNGPVIHVHYFESGAGGAISKFDEREVLEGSDAVNIGNPDVAAPIPIGQGGRIVTDTNTTANPPITTKRQVLTTNLYVLWMEKNGTASQLMGALLNDGVQEHQTGDNQTTIQVTHPLVTGLVQGATTFGASALPDGNGFVTVTVKPNKATATVTYFKWDPTVDTYTVSNAFQEDIALPAGLPSSYNGNIVCAITRNYDRMSRWYPYRLTIALDPCQSGNSIRVRDYRLNDKMQPTFFPRYFLTAVPKDNQWHTVGNPTNNFHNVTNLITAADGRLLLADGESNGITLYARTGFDPATQQALWQAPGSGELVQPFTDSMPAFIWRPQFPAVAPADNVDVKFPVVRDMFVKNEIGSPGVNPNDLAGYEVSTSEQAHRLPLPPAVGSVATVLGIVDGPPPIPNENFATAAPNDPRAFQLVASDMAFNWTRTASTSTESEYQSSLSVGLSTSIGHDAGEEGGFSFDVELSGEVAWTHGNTYSRTTGDTVEQFAKFANSTTTDPSGKIIVTPLGSLYCEYQTFRGYSYEFLDANNNAIAGSQVYTQVWPDGAPTIQVLDYWMNPNGRQPGHLESYIVDSATRAQLQSQNTVKFSGASSTSDPAGSGGDHLYFGFTDSNTVGDTWDHFVQDSSKTSEGIKIGEALKISASYDWKVIKVGGTVSVAHDSEETHSRTTALSDSVGVVSECNVNTDRNVPNTYYHESYETFLLKDDNHYLQELLSDDPNGIGLVTTSWPPIGSKMRQDNEAIKAQLIRTSAPWKVTYILSDTPLKTHSIVANSAPNARNLQGTGGAEGAEGLDPKLVAKLKRYGITTTGLADLLIQKWYLSGASRSVLLTNVPWDVRLREQRAKTAQLDRVIHRYFPNVRRFDAALRSLTAADVQALRGYQAARDQRSYADYLKANPVRYPVYTPQSIMRLPAIHNTGPLFTQIPPAGQ